MAFGINRKELMEWKQKVDRGEIAFLTHYWLDDRFPDSKTVTKVGCSDFDKLVAWGKKYGLKKDWIDYREDGYSHFDLIGKKQEEILQKVGLLREIQKKFQ